MSTEAETTSTSRETGVDVTNPQRGAFERSATTV